jgi:hypothetical protein
MPVASKFDWPILPPEIVQAHRDYLEKEVLPLSVPHVKNARLFRGGGKRILSHGHGLKLIGSYKTPFAWDYRESPVDARAMSALSEFDPALHEEISNGWHRKHGGFEGVASTLQGYDRVYTNFNKFTPQQQSNFHLAYEAVKNLLRPSAYKVGVKSVLSYRPDSNTTSSGLPYLRPKIDVLDIVISDANILVDEIRASPGAKFESFQVPPVIPFVKSIPSKQEKMKTRAVWAYPAVMTCIESCFGVQLYRKLIRSVSPGGIPIMQGRGAFAHARAFVSNVPPGVGVLALDFVKGDQQLPAWILRMAKSLLEEHIDFSMFEDSPVSQAQADGNKRVWDFVWWYFINTPIVFDDMLYRKTAGVPSGSLFTLLAWNMVSLIVRAYLMISLDGRMPRTGDLAVCGDDGVSRVYVLGRTADDYISAALDVGFLFHPAPKSQLAYWPRCVEVQTLSTVFDDPLVIRRSEIDLFARACFPMSWNSSREESVARLLMLDLSVLCTMKKFHKFVLFYFSYKYLSLHKPIRVDREIEQKFKYVLGISIASSTTLSDLIPMYKDTVRVTWMLTTT